MVSLNSDNKCSVVCFSRENDLIMDINYKVLTSRKIILDTNNSINDKTEMLLFLAARSQLVQNIILPKLKSNYFVICDRFTDSTLAYQGYGRKININFTR